VIEDSMTIRSLLFVLACGCTGVNTHPVEPDAAPDAPPPIDAPTLLTTHHYVMDKQIIPQTTTQARDVALDLDGNATLDNQLGQVTAAFSSMGFDVQTPADLAVDRGSTLVLVDLEANGFTNSEARFTLFGGANPQPPACTNGADTVCRHHLDGTGSFTVVATSTHDALLAGSLAQSVLVTGVNSVGHLQIQTNLVTTNPVTLNLVGARVKVSGPSATGITSGVIAGAVTATEIDGTLLPAWQQSFNAAMLKDCPGGPPSCGCVTGSQGKDLQQLFDTNPRDCVISVVEIKNNALIQGLIAPDVTIDGQQALSLAIGFTATKATFTP
jgi:hypothetical protein